ncbi:hypothetical protein [Nocardia sp. NPDC057440]|uniref:hypothetical protein n=1 Tax=Nocardia sp. NPDC057440 TaxID=3346134 RepID=UPI00367038A6
MTSKNKLAAVLATAAVSVAACAAHGAPEAAVNRHEGVAGCIQWWWNEDGTSTTTTTIHWHNMCPTMQRLMVSWRNNRTTVDPDDVLYGIPGGHEGSETWAGVPIAFKQL